MQQKKALLLESWYASPDSHWFPWLRKELENRGYEVYIPDLPTINTNLLDMEKMIKCVEDLKVLDKETVVIGHSIGSVLALRLAERYRFGKMILVAGWDFDDLQAEHQLFWPNKINHDRIKKNVKEIYCLTSDNDPYTTAYQVEEMSKRLGGKFILVPGAGHFTEKFNITTLPQVLECV